jgi:hypothetical protein
MPSQPDGAALRAGWGLPHAAGICRGAGSGYHRDRAPGRGPNPCGNPNAEAPLAQTSSHPAAGSARNRGRAASQAAANAAASAAANAEPLVAAGRPER